MNHDDPYTGVDETRCPVGRCYTVRSQTGVLDIGISSYLIAITDFF